MVLPVRRLTEYKEEEWLQLSGIQHFTFCRRQWALVHIEQQWAENWRTTEGELIHEKAHDGTANERRGDFISLHALPIHSRTLGISGECDIVELRRNKNGVFLPKYHDTFSITPVEYKRGRDKEGLEDVLQLTAQAMCLEEMLCCHIPKGYLYYYEKRHRTAVELSDDLRQKVEEICAEMHQYYDRKYTPKGKRTKKCNACSLKNICLPALNANPSVASYLNEVLKEGDG